MSEPTRQDADTALIKIAKTLQDKEVTDRVINTLKIRDNEYEFVGKCNALLRWLNELDIWRVYGLQRERQKLVDYVGSFF